MNEGREETMRRLVDKTAIVTGASRGIGLAIAERLAAEGARVVVTARKQDALDEAVRRLGGPEKALGVPGHADGVDHQAEVVKRPIDTFGGVDLLVNNTGINPTYGPLVNLDLTTARKIVEVNCIAALSWVQQTLDASYSRDLPVADKTPRPARRGRPARVHHGDRPRRLSNRQSPRRRG